MPATVRLPGFLGPYAGGSLDAAVPAATAGEALRALVRRHPGLGVRLLDARGGLASHLAAFRNGSALPRAGLDEAPLADGDLLEIVPAAAGG